MPKKETLFEELVYNLYNNIIPSIICDLKKLGMQYSHVPIYASHSMVFFNHVQTPYPFNNIIPQTVRNEHNQEVPILILNIKYNGEVSICTGLTINNQGLTYLENNFILYDYFTGMFVGVRYDNTFLFLLSEELTKKAEMLKADIDKLEELNSRMKRINPAISREVLTEKK